MEQIADTLRELAQLFSDVRNVTGRSEWLDADSLILALTVEHDGGTAG